MLKTTSKNAQISQENGTSIVKKRLKESFLVGMALKFILEGH